VPGAGEPTLRSDSRRVRDHRQGRRIAAPLLRRTGMSLRAVAVRGVSASRLRVMPRLLSLQRTTPRENLWTRLADDRDLIGVKVCMMIGLFLLVMMLEVSADLIGRYLQTKAMLNAYRWSSVELITREQNAAAIQAAAEALVRGHSAAVSEEDELDFLPLWLSAERVAEPAGHH